MVVRELRDLGDVYRLGTAAGLPAPLRWPLKAPPASKHCPYPGQLAPVPEALAVVSCGQRGTELASRNNERGVHTKESNFRAD